jgi:phage gpG-like protein
MDNKNKIPDFSAMGIDLIKNAARYAASESVKTFKESFVNQGFSDTSFVPWHKSLNPFAGKRTLYKSGTLMQSIRKVEETIKRIVVESDTDYSEIHNSGGTITVTAQMKKFWWAKYYELSGKVKTTTKGKMSRSQSNLKTNDKAEFCKRMALMKVGTKIKIPKDQFMGNSQIMMNGFDAWYKGQLEISFKHHLNK